MENTDFQKLVIDEVIPHIEKMISKEESHLSFLKDNNSPQDFVDNSEHFIRFYKMRLRQYENYLNV
jgi:hypothetical protein